ncbi:MAG TPA: hypothetical protein VGM50_05675, partial [Gemmatimonadaceae bacterium]
MELIVVNAERRRGKILILELRLNSSVQVVRRPNISGDALEIEMIHHHLGDVRLRRETILDSFGVKAGNIPSRSDEAVERVVEFKGCFDGVMREIVQRKEAAELSLLALPGGGAVGADAAERRIAVRFFLD